MKKTIFFQLIFSLTLLIQGCNTSTCTNLNPIFEKYSPDSKEYKTELINQLNHEDRTRLTYWFHDYKKIGNRESLYFKVKGKYLCAIMVVNINGANTLQDLRNKKGVTYRGAEFVNLKYEIIHDSTVTEFRLISYERIID